LCNSCEIRPSVQVRSLPPWSRATDQPALPVASSPPECGPHSGGRSARPSPKSCGQRCAAPSAGPPVSEPDAWQQCDRHRQRPPRVAHRRPHALGLPRAVKLKARRGSRTAYSCSRNHARKVARGSPSREADERTSARNFPNADATLRPLLGAGFPVATSQTSCAALTIPVPVS